MLSLVTALSELTCLSVDYQEKIAQRQITYRSIYLFKALHNDDNDLYSCGYHFVQSF
jgi:hypothetical protein